MIYATCFSNYNNPEIGMATRAVLARNGVETEVVYPVCCGMPKLEHGDFEEVARRAEKVAAEMMPWIEKGYEVIALVPSCALMLKFEWPLIVPENEDVKLLSANTRDVAEYIVDISKREGLAPGMQPLDGGVTVISHAIRGPRNMGQKATEMLRLLPEADVTPIERCSGHGGSWGVLKENFEIASKWASPLPGRRPRRKEVSVRPNVRWRATISVRVSTGWRTIHSRSIRAGTLFSSWRNPTG